MELNIPEFAKWITQDRYGVVKVFDEKPALQEGRWVGGCTVARPSVVGPFNHIVYALGENIPKLTDPGLLVMMVQPIIHISVPVGDARYVSFDSNGTITLHALTPRREGPVWKSEGSEIVMSNPGLKDSLEGQMRELCPTFCGISMEVPTIVIPLKLPPGVSRVDVDRGGSLTYLRSGVFMDPIEWDKSSSFLPIGGNYDRCSEIPLERKQ